MFSTIDLGDPVLIFADRGAYPGRYKFEQMTCILMTLTTGLEYTNKINDLCVCIHTRIFPKDIITNLNRENNYTATTEFLVNIF